YLNASCGPSPSFGYSNSIFPGKPKRYRRYPLSLLSSLEEHSETILACFPTAQLKTIFSSRSHNEPACSCATFDAPGKLNESTNNNAAPTLLVSIKALLIACSSPGNQSGSTLRRSCRL